MSLSIGTLTQNVKFKELLDYMRTTYAPMGKRFWYCHISDVAGYNMRASIARLTICVLLLALVCHNFDYVLTASDESDKFVSEFKKKVDEFGFNQDTLCL
ncbi:hypothetical protein GGI21_004938, partial [Coemansia aciculifera]